jgi:hypothetical protein
LCVPLIPALQRLRQKDHEFWSHPQLRSEFQARLGYIARPCLKKQEKERGKRRKGERMTRGLMHSASWASPQTFFGLVIFQIRFFAWANLDHDPPTYVSYITGIAVCHHTQLVCSDRSLANFLSTLALIYNPDLCLL